jgi:hypothetical protein
MLFQVSIITGILYVVLLTVSIWAIRICSRKDAPIGWMFLALHGLLYYVVFSIDYYDHSVNAQFYNYWSIALRVHFLIFGISLLGSLVWRIKKINHGC